MKGVDLRLRVVNTYQPPVLQAFEDPVRTVPKTIDTIIRHALNSPDPNPAHSREYEHFLDWIAFIIQARERTGTAWLLHGTQGTGKGVILHNILRPLIGESNFSVVNMQTMAEKFTDRLDDKILVGLDEIKREDFIKHPGLMNRLKNTITEETITSRRFHNAPRESNNYTNFLLTSNEQVPIEIPANDRRFNVAFSQPKPLRIRFGGEDKTNQAINMRIPAELPRFKRFLQDRRVSRGLVSVAMNNRAKMSMIAAGRTATQSFFDLIRSGQIAEFRDEYNRLQLNDCVTSAILENPTVISMETIDRFKTLCESHFLNGVSGTVVLFCESMFTLDRVMLGRRIPMTPQRYTAWLSQFGFAEATIECAACKKPIKGVPMQCQEKS